jgi:hypothetical protein
MTMAMDIKSSPYTHDAAPSGYKMQLWAALSFMISVPVLCILFNQGGLLRVVFPLLSLTFGGFLLWRWKPHFVGLVFWLWFITPFVGRIADMQGGWTGANPVGVAPYITAGLVVLPLLSNLQCLRNRMTLPYVCAIASILYGLIIGVRYLPLFNLLRALLDWIVPVVFGLFIYENRRLYPEFRRVIEKSFLYGVLLMGAYGIYQFFALPDWDRIWMLNVQMNSFGEMNPMKTRVFSTMNAPPVFAAVMACGLLLLFNMKGKLRLLSAACGFTSFVFTLSRAAWLNFAFGCVFLGFRLGMRTRPRLAVASLACVAFLIGVMQVPGVRLILQERVRTLAQPGQDVSYSARVEGHEQALLQIAQEPWGEGVGSTDTLHKTEGSDAFIGPHDSTVLEFLFSLGWIGTLIYSLGVLLLGVQLVRTGRSDPFVVSAQAIMIGFLAQCLLNSVLLGPIGFMVWTFASMIIAAPENEEVPYGMSEPNGKPAPSYAIVNGVRDAGFAHPQ